MTNRKKTKAERRADLHEAVRMQRHWIEDHGGTGHGYVLAYSLAFCGGEIPPDEQVTRQMLIYEADKAHLERLESEVAALDAELRR